MSETLHLIFGTGPAGIWTARALRGRGLTVRAVNRSGISPALMPSDVEVVAADASDQAQAIQAAEGAAVVYQALNPPPLQWGKLFPGLQAGALAAARAAGAVYVSIENLYLYGRTAGAITEGSPAAPISKKGRIRAEMAREVMGAHDRGELRATALRSSDYYGPGVLGSALGERTFGFMVAGRKAQVAGNADVLHSFAYVEDVGRAAAALGTRDEALGRVWIAPHAPAQTQRQMVEQAYGILGIHRKLSVISPLAMRLAGLVNDGARATVEMMYEFTEPMEVDSSRIQRELGLLPTTIAEGLARTVAWYAAAAASRA